MSKKANIKRAEATVSGNLVKALTPGFLTLVKNPANQRAFSIVRSADATADKTKTARRVSRRADTATHMPLIQFPEGYTVEQAQTRIAEFGLISYEVLENEGSIQAQRSDLQSAANPEALVPIRLTEDGIVAYVKRAESGGEATAGKSRITVVAFELDTTVLTEEQINSFIERNSVDKEDTAIDNSGDTVTVLRRSEIDEGEDIRRVQVEDGVMAVITRSETEDIPDGFTVVINESAYGQWGWGQLDLFAVMADRYVSQQLEDGLYYMRDILSRILFYSDLPLDMRKALVSRTLAQYEAFVNELIDLLPRQLLLAVTQDVQRSTKEPTTSQENAMSGTAAPQTQTTAAPVATTGISRSEAEALVKAAVEGVTANLGDTIAAAIKRSQEDAAKAEADAAAAKAEADTAAAALQETIKRSVEDATKPLQEEIAALKGQTVTRSAPTGTEVAAAPAGTEGKTVKRSAEEVFRGALPGLGLTRAQQAEA